LELYLHDKPTADNVDIKAIARGTPGFNGAGEYYFNIFYMTITPINVNHIFLQIPD